MLALVAALGACGDSGGDEATVAQEAAESVAAILEDGIVTDEEYEAAFFRMYDCMIDSGIELSAPSRDADGQFGFVIYGIDDLETSPIEARYQECEALHYSEVVGVWVQQNGIGVLSDDFYRPIAIGESGSDVDALRDLAFVGGHYGDSEPDTGRFTYADRRAARLLMESLGWPRATRLTTIPISSLLWIPEEPFTAERLLIWLGDYIDPGAAVVEGSIELDSVVLLSPVLADASRYVFTSRDGLSVDLGAVSAELGRLTAALPHDQLLIASEGGLQIDGTVRLRDPRIAWTVPSAAITLDPKNGACALFLEESGKPVVRQVDIVGGGLDIAEIEPLPGFDVDGLSVVVGTEPVEC